MKTNQSQAVRHALYRLHIRTRGGWHSLREIGLEAGVLTRCAWQWVEGSGDGWALRELEQKPGPSSPQGGRRGWVYRPTRAALIDYLTTPNGTKEEP